MPCGTSGGRTSPMTPSDGRHLTRQGWAATAVACTVVMLSACSGGADEPSGLPLYTGGGSASPGTSSASPTTASPSGASSGASSGPAGKAQTFTIQRGALPAGLTGDTAAAAEAWLVYWEYLAVADSIPFVDPATSGTVMTGAAATKANAYAAKLQKAKTHVIGSVRVDMTSAVVNGSKATLCGRLKMNAFEFDARDQPVESTLRTILFFKGTAVKAGPTWRISDYVNLRKPC